MATRKATALKTALTNKGKPKLTPASQPPLSPKAIQSDDLTISDYLSLFYRVATEISETLARISGTAILIGDSLDSLSRSFDDGSDDDDDDDE